jgi:hypothetical protein
MELLLNLVWVTIALAAFSVFLRKNRETFQLSAVPYNKALLALAFVLVLLFPFVSASDDLHPTQAVLEDATKRMPQVVAPNLHAQSGSFAAVLPLLLASSLAFALVALHRWHPNACEARVICRERTPRAGRSPPPPLS